jgi:hypothetical protein
MSAERDRGEAPPQTTWGWFVLLVVVALGAFELGWKIGRTRIEDELQQLRRASEWQLPQNLQALGDLSRKVSLQLQERQELLTNRQNVMKLTARVEELQVKIASVEDANTKLAAEAAGCTPDVLTVEVGEAKQFAPGWSVGVKTVNTTSNEAVVQTGPNLNTLSVGTSTSYEINGTKYTVTLAKVGPLSCRFEIIKAKR